MATRASDAPTRACTTFAAWLCALYRNHAECSAGRGAVQLSRHVMRFAFRARLSLGIRVAFIFFSEGGGGQRDDVGVSSRSAASVKRSCCERCLCVCVCANHARCLSCFVWRCLVHWCGVAQFGARPFSHIRREALIRKPSPRALQAYEDISSSPLLTGLLLLAHRVGVWVGTLGCWQA